MAVVLQQILMRFKRFLLKSFPSSDFPKDLSCFELDHNAEIDENVVLEGSALIKICWVSLDPLLRTWISGARSYLDPVKPGSSIPGFGVAKIVKINPKAGSKSGMEAGDWVIGMLEWSEYAIMEIKNIKKLPIDLQEQGYKFLTVYGPTGFTSFWSIKQQILPFEIWSKSKGRMKTKEELNILISSVAGGVGLTLTEYLLKLGYRNIYGIAGSDEKCKVAKDIGCKDAINYKQYYSNGVINARQFQKDIRSMMNGQEVDLYYQNVGEDMLSSALKLMADHGKVVMCGALATYNNWTKKSGSLNFQQIISKRIQMKGILYYDLDFNTRVKAFMQMISLDAKGVEVIINGIQNLPNVYRDMIDGRYTGKPVVQFFNPT